jgi:DNA polymerase-3 subunit beta
MDIIFSARTADLLKKSENDVIISFVDTRNKITHARFDTENTVIVSRIIDEKFPPYETVIPINNTLFIKFSKTELLNTVKRISIFANQINHQIKMKLSADDIIIGAEDDDTASSGFESINGEFNGEPLEIGFNHRLLEELIQYIDTGDEDRIRFEFSEQSKAVLIKADDDSDILIMIIMPSRTK